METLRVPIAALRSGAVSRSLAIEDAEGTLGELPLPLGRLEPTVEVGGDPRAGVRARGRVRADSDVPCRRCLTPVPLELDVKLDVWFRPSTEVDPGEEGVWPIDPEAGDVDLTEPVREELWVALPEYVECDTACRGLCPTCGVRLADEVCSCEPPGPDPRWDALRALGTAEEDVDVQG